MCRLLLLLLLMTGTAGAVESHAVIFLYHRFGEDRYPSTSIRMAQFEAQLDWLAKNDYQVWPLERIVEHLQSNTAIPDHTVAITIDDAYLSIHKRALPLLRKHRWPFTVFVSSDTVDQHLPDYMSWEQMRELTQHGARFANHGASHGYLWRHKPGEDGAAWRARIRADIEKGAARLNAELGDGVARSLFAYPYGEYDGALADLITELGYVGFGQHSGVISASADRRALPRFPMSEHFASLKEFAGKAAALPLEVVAPPREPLAKNNPPVLDLTLAPAQLDWSRLACYEGGAPIAVQWLEAGRKVRIVAKHPLSAGLARYSCTVPDGNRFRWFTQPWLIPAR